MKVTIVFLLIILLSVSLAYALDCQYIDSERYTEFGIQLYSNESDKISKQPVNAQFNISNFEVNYDDKTRVCKLLLNINNGFAETIIVKFNYVVHKPPPRTTDLKTSDTHYKEISVQRFSSSPVEDILKDLDGCTINYDEISYTIEPYNLVSGKGYISKSRKICKLCQGQNCLNDDGSCTKPQECGGGYCIESHCSNSTNCLNNDCKCSTDKIQCGNNKCVKADVIPVDVKPECNKPQECVTGYISSTTELCAKSPTQVNEEETNRLNKEKDEDNKRIKEDLERNERERKFTMYYIIGLTLLILSGIVIIVYLINKWKTNEIVRIKKKMELIRLQVREKNEELEQTKQDLREINNLSKAKKENIKKLEKLKNDEEFKLRELENSRNRRKVELENIRSDIQKINELTKSKEEKQIIFKRLKQVEEAKLTELKDLGNKREEESKNIGRRIERINEGNRTLKEELERFERLKLGEQNTFKELKKLDYQAQRLKKNSKEYYFKKYFNRYGNKIYLDNKEYLRFYGNNQPLHQYIYGSYYSLNNAKEIHHIDANQLNNDIWNLIELTHIDHRKLRHAKITHGDWLSGITQLKEQLGLKDSDFPEEVRKHLLDK